MGCLARHLGRALAVALVGLWPSVMVAAEAGCAAPAPVCAARAAVFAVSAFDPMASAVRVAPDLLVTNRHVVADDSEAEILLPDGERLTADVVPSSYPGDLALLRVEGLPVGPIPPIVALDPEARLHTVAAERGRIRAYGEGRVILAPAPAKPLARLHHSAYSQPGNSGGALVDAAGRLVAIVTSGGAGRNEAIPAREIARLRARSGAGHLADHRRIGVAYRLCIEGLEAGRSARRDAALAALVRACRETGNRQLYELAGQALGRAGRLDQAVALFEAALAQDPNAVNSRVSLAVTLDLARRYEAAVPHLAWLIEVAPADAQILRLAVQAGKWGGAPALAARALGLLERHHPQAADAARRFLESDAPRPRSP